jgi:hypothetical protein
MTEFSEVALNRPEAFDFVAECLSRGNTLSRLIRKTIDLRLGHITTFLPPGTSEAAAYEFDFGGKLPPPNATEWLKSEDSVAVPIPTALPLLVSKIRAFVGKATGNVCLLENSLASKSDPYTQSMRSRIVSYGEEIYHVLTRHNSSEEAIDAAIDEAFAIPTFVGVFTSLPGDEAQRLRDAVEIGSESLGVCAENVQSIIVGAYDGESFLIWSR